MKCPIGSITILFITVLICPVSALKTINVPGDSKNIQSAIDMAEQGDTIIVAPGKYQEDTEIGITTPCEDILYMVEYSHISHLPSFWAESHMRNYS